MNALVYVLQAVGPLKIGETSGLTRRKGADLALHVPANAEPGRLSLLDDGRAG